MATGPHCNCVSVMRSGRIGIDDPVDADGRTDVVTDQSQVDDLLASLGF